MTHPAHPYAIPATPSEHPNWGQPRPARTPLAWLVVFLGVGLVALINHTSLFVQPAPVTPEQGRAIRPDEEQVTRAIVSLTGAFPAGPDSDEADRVLRMLYASARPDAGAPDRWAQLRSAMLAARAPEPARHTLRDLLRPAAQAPARAADAAGDQDTAAYLADAADVAAVLNSGSAADVPPERASALIERHGVNARWLLSAGRPIDAGSELGALSRRGPLVLAVLVPLGLLLALAALSGVGVLIAWLVRMSSPRRAPAAIGHAPVPPGAERIGPRIAAVFVAGFLAVMALGAVGVIPPASLGHTVAAHFALLLALALTIALTGPTGSGAALGLTAGRGLTAEVGAGILWWLGTLPLLLVAMLVTFGLLLVSEYLWPSSGPPANPVADLIFSASPLELALLLLLASVWAPVTEELVFRGGVLGSLRRPLGVLPAVALSAVCFALMHSYALPLLLPVLTLGASMGVLRARRGSLIGCVTMHAVHNSAIMGSLIALRLALDL
ncbi:MAG: hypothetical protein C0475_02165 [Planctomyces sp.]|nr:hypothetical protein [Planctomyces sp.]MBA4119833.1 hypothetical protein [Isosphaera sp.]